MIFQRFFTPELSIYTYLLADPKTVKCLVVDPVRLIDPLVNWIEGQGFILQEILETHVHADFISGAKELKAHFNNKPQIHCSSLGGKQWVPTYLDEPVTEGTEIQIGQYRLQ